MARAVWFVVGAITIASGTAYALKPGMHADIARDSCKRAGLSTDFCTRIATEDYNTDSREWDDLSAHAQIEDGETACTSADHAAERLRKLGNDLRTALVTARSGSTTDVGAVGSIVGRALHTIQDNCAHHGMPNPQHAWLSLGDFCQGTATNPDVQEDAFTCARTESDAVMQVVAEAVSQANVASVLSAHSCPPAPNNNSNHNNNPPAICQSRFLPSPFEACDFLGRAKDWDGTDRRWNNAVTTPALRAAFAAGLAGNPALSVCNGDESRLSAAVSNPIADVSAGAPTCGKASLFCLGKADDAADNPFADDPTTDDTGCNTTGGSSLWVVGLALLALRRRQTPRMKA